MKKIIIVLTTMILLSACGEMTNVEVEQAIAKCKLKGKTTELWLNVEGKVVKTACSGLE